MLPLPVKADCLGSTVSFSKQTVAASALCKLQHRPASNNKTAALEREIMVAVSASPLRLVCCCSIGRSSDDGGLSNPSPTPPKYDTNSYQMQIDKLSEQTDDSALEF